MRALLEAGLTEEAVAELRPLERQARTLNDRLEVAALYSAAGNDYRAERSLLDAYSVRLAQVPEPGQEALWWLAWPRPYADRVEAAGSRGAEPDLVLAVMREESGYRPKVVSPVGARGLLQIMPETGSQLASQLGENPFDPDSLFEPETNIRFGAFYLAQLLEQFDGRTSAAVGSYNAGPHRVVVWLRERGDLEDDEWVEAIPFDQTRRYVRRVLRSLHAYRVLY